MADKELVITHLQIIHTWAEFARERDLQFFTSKHLEDIAQWSDDAINLLKEKEEEIESLKQTCQSMMEGAYLLKEQETVEHALDVLRKNGWKEEETCEKCTLLKEQEVLLKRAYELLADMDLDFFCEDLICNDGWCDDHCTTNGTTPECIERWLRKQISEGR